MKIIFIRHGETEYPIKDGAKLTYDSTAPLTQQGERDIFQVAGVLKGRNYPIRRLHSSTYKRAHRTAEIIRQVMDIDELHLYSTLRDVDVPQYLGREVGSTPKDYYEVQPWPEGHETLEELTSRSRAAVNFILNNHSDDSVHLIVSHRDTILSALFHLQHDRSPQSLEELLTISHLERGEALITNLYEGTFNIEERIGLETYRKSKEG